MDANELEERLIKFAILMIEIVELLPYTKAGNHLGGQLVRSGTSHGLHYGEVKAAESKRDFTHKLKVVLKEIRETHNCLKVIAGAKLLKESPILENALTECNELISIFVKSVKTAEANK